MGVISLSFCYGGHRRIQPILLAAHFYSPQGESIIPNRSFKCRLELRKCFPLPSLVVAGRGFSGELAVFLPPLVTRFGESLDSGTVPLGTYDICSGADPLEGDGLGPGARHLETDGFNSRSGPL
jgi:hypothetical protein